MQQIRIIAQIRNATAGLGVTVCIFSRRRQFRDAAALFDESPQLWRNA